LYLRPHPLEVKFEMSTRANGLGAILNWFRRLHPVCERTMFQAFVGLASRLQIQGVEISNSARQKPRGESGSIFTNVWHSMGGKKGNISQRDCHLCGNLQIGILFPPLSLCSHPGTALGLRIAPVNGEKRPMCECFNIASKPLSV
jgi:hypothetical protein